MRTRATGTEAMGTEAMGTSCMRATSSRTTTLRNTASRSTAMKTTAMRTTAMRAGAIEDSIDLRSSVDLRNRVTDMGDIPTTEIYGELAPMVTSPLEHILRLREEGEGHVLHMGENEGVSFYQTWKPSHARYVLQENEKGYIREPTGHRFAPLTIGGRPSHENLIIGVDGDRWQQKRKALRGSFIKKYTSDFVGVAAECCEESLGTWSWTENISYQCFHLMFSAILRYVLGIQADEPTKRGVWRALPQINRYFHNGLFTKKNIMNESYDQSFGFCRDFFSQAIDDRLAGPRYGRQDLLSHIAQGYDLNNSVDRQQMATDILSVSLAGADAPSLALAWTLYAIARNPEVKSRLMEEIDGVLVDHPPTRQNLAGLRYTQAVVQESLRLYPPAWYTPRTNIEEDALDGVRIPPGSTVIVFQYLMHQDPEFWNNGTEFVPERFLNSNQHPAYMPYGWGPRYCFAADYAHSMLVAFVALIFQKYDLWLLSPEPPQMSAYVNLRMKEDLHLQVEPRT